MSCLLKNATIYTEKEHFLGSILIQGKRISKIIKGVSPTEEDEKDCTIIDCSGKWILPGVIDEHVHFREPGFTYKASIASETHAALAGGVTSFMDMPNNNPQTATVERLNEKFDSATRDSLCNYSFYMGATNYNFRELLRDGVMRACGIKVFMGSSTGNILVDKDDTLNFLFREAPLLITTHCEEERIIRRNLVIYMEKYHRTPSPAEHSLIRSRSACLLSTKKAIELAKKYRSHLHILHISTQEEVEMIERVSKEYPYITCEVSVNHLLFTGKDCEREGSKLKCNPALKEERDRNALREGVARGIIKTIATDHAPHLLKEKEGDYIHSLSGIPMIQHSLLSMLELTKEGVFRVEDVVRSMSSAVADLYHLKDRGHIREGEYADLVIIDPSTPHRVTQENLLYRCGWSPTLGYTFPYSVWKTILNGEIAYSDGKVNEEVRGMELTFQKRRL